MAKLYFRYAAMNAGKTTVLLQVAHNYEENGMKVILLKSEIDTKGDRRLVSRLGISRAVDILLNENDSVFTYIDEIKRANCILVDEAQFLKVKQVDELWYISKVLDIPVICYGLRKDFKSNMFEGSKRLLEVSDELEELVTICSYGKKAKFNARKINGEYTLDGNQVEIDNNTKVKYESLCGKCYIKKVLKMNK